MTSVNEFTCQYKLDKQYFIECYEQSTTTTSTSIKKYNKSLFFIIVGTAMLLTQLNSYASWFLIALGILEALSVKFQKSWWLMRQMFSKAANSDIRLTINEQHIQIHSYYVNKTLPWSEVSQVIKTEKGFIVFHGKARHYLSNQHLNNVIIKFISNKVKK
ncbi:YcxB family protein [uncultured Shewanella sp.]|uniref:YcxB family protein n=1 Tax=uncultured Shewanella sp. TaxID=173975 RepID=UPI0026382691|nr:YcxB family protein [uncultured Shewanella sp.]